MLGLCAVSLAGCDAAADIAGDAIRAEARNAVIQQCQQASQEAGIVAGRIASICECSADTFLADQSFTAADIDPARLEEILNGCVARTGGAVSLPAAAADEANAE
ncbi:hypothetical protein ACFODK_07380 [Altererythrobacter lauratis]|uniref:Secreted protein n=2 Tax=Alteraurantiacibacter lauratis TaxID=2054627 RepID=A0ABV7EDB7_9SPHN